MSASCFPSARRRFWVSERVWAWTVRSWRRVFSCSRDFSSLERTSRELAVSERRRWRSGALRAVGSNSVSRRRIWAWRCSSRRALAWAIACWREWIFRLRSSNWARAALSRSFSLEGLLVLGEAFFDGLLAVDEVLIAFDAGGMLSGFGFVLGYFGLESGYLATDVFRFGSPALQVLNLQPEILGA